MQHLFCITWNATRSVCFIKSVPVVFSAHSDLALQLLESRNASAASRVISAVGDGEQAVSAGHVKLSSRTSARVSISEWCVQRAPSALPLIARVLLEAF